MDPRVMAAPARPVIVEESLGSSSLTYAVTSLPSRKNEDRWAVKTQELPWAGASEGPNGMFAVMDGHGGCDAAESCRVNLLQAICRRLESSTAICSNASGWPDDVRKCHHTKDRARKPRARATFNVVHGQVDDVIVQSFEELDADIQEDDGTTATVVLVKTSPTGEIYVKTAWAGDSRAVLAVYDRDSRAPKITDLSIDHKADVPDEIKRIEHFYGGMQWGFNADSELSGNADGLPLVDTYRRLSYALAAAEISESEEAMTRLSPSGDGDLLDAPPSLASTMSAAGRMSNSSLAHESIPEACEAGDVALSLPLGEEASPSGSATAAADAEFNDDSCHGFSGSDSPRPEALPDAAPGGDELGTLSPLASFNSSRTCSAFEAEISAPRFPEESAHGRRHNQQSVLQSVLNRGPLPPRRAISENDGHAYNRGDSVSRSRGRGRRMGHASSDIGPRRTSFVGRAVDAKTGSVSKQRLFGGVIGSIGMTRSIGDRKAARACISTPDIRDVALPAGQPARLIVATDGVWDSI